MPQDNAPMPPESTHRVSTSGDIEVSTYLEIAQEREGTPGKHSQRRQPVSSPLEAIAVVDYGSQYSRLIARRIREQNVYCELISPSAPRESVAGLDLKGIVLSGGPSSVYEDGAPTAQPWVFDSGVPVLGICYGMQLITQLLGGKVNPSYHREFGRTKLMLKEFSYLFLYLEALLLLQ